MDVSHLGHVPSQPVADGDAIGSVRIAHRALRTMIEQAALRTPGVAGVARMARPFALGRPIPWRGIGLAVRDDAVSIDVYLLAEHDSHLALVGAQVQEAVASSVEQLLGMRVHEVNIFIRDVL
jgi:uncharacterized alkaline shock family protein YloU